MAYSKAKLKSSGHKVSPYFKPSVIGNVKTHFLLALPVSWGYQTE